MNELLAQIYGTEKVASEEEELDLTQISAADFLAALEEAEEGEKVASDEIDLTQISAADFLAALEEEEQEKVASEEMILEKMAQDGMLDYYDMAGRIMAHSLHNEMNKLASDEDEIAVDLNDLSAADLVELVNAGYEFEKEASKMQAAKDWVSSAAAKGKDAYMSALKAENFRTAPGLKGKLIGAGQTAAAYGAPATAALGAGHMIMKKRKKNKQDEQG